MKRVFDLTAGLVFLSLFLFPMLIIAVAVRVTSLGPVLHWSDRVGQGNVIFKMPKFRTMSLDTPPVASHLLKSHKKFLTPIGEFLRRSSLDELPQLFSILKGEMSFVGPRPALFNQDDLIAFRNKNGLDKLLPGLTGWAQVNGRDELTIQEKVSLDLEYLEKQSFWFDLRILWLTCLNVLKRDNISH